MQRRSFIAAVATVAVAGCLEQTEGGVDSNSVPPEQYSRHTFEDGDPARLEYDVTIDGGVADVVILESSQFEDWHAMDPHSTAAMHERTDRVSSSLELGTDEYEFVIENRYEEGEIEYTLEWKTEIL